MERCLVVDENKEVEYIYPEHLPTEPYFSIHYPCLCGQEVILVPMTLSRYMARGLQDLRDPNEQYRNWALFNRSNGNHVYPEPHNNFLIDCGDYESGESEENEDDGNANRDLGDHHIRDDGDENEGDPPQRPRNYSPERRCSIAMDYSDHEESKEEDNEPER